LKLFYYLVTGFKIFTAHFVQLGQYQICYALGLLCLKS